ASQEARLRSRAPRNRNHGDRPARSPGSGEGQYGEAARARREDRAGRFRRRLFQPAAPATLPVQQAQDRPRIHHRLHRRGAIGHRDPRCGKHRPRTGDEGHRRRRRNRKRRPVPQDRGRPRTAGLPVRQARAARGISHACLPADGAFGLETDTDRGERRVEITILRVPHANVKTIQGVFLEAAECGSYPFNHGYRGRSFMLDRRSVLLSSAAAGAVALIGVPPLAAAETDTAKLNGLFDSFVDARLDRSPEEVTQLGLDKDARAAQKSLLDDRSLAGIASDRKRNADELAQLNAIDRNALTGMDAINYDVVHYGLATAVASARRHDYGGANAGIPYVVSNFGGAYQSIPDFLDSQHAIEIKADADAYLARLSAFATALDQEDEVIRHDAGVGAVPPDFVLSRTLSLIENLSRPKPELSTLVSSVARRAKEKDIAGDYAGDAMRIVAEKIYPALDRQMETLKSLQPKAVHDAGVWRLPNGEQYYKDSLTAWATTDRAPNDIHQTGLDLVADFTARIDALMKANDLTKGTVGERLRAMYDDPKFRYPNTDAGKEKLIADLNVKMAEVKKRLPQYFGVLPKADVVIKRVPKAIEEGQAGGYYQN